MTATDSFLLSSNIWLCGQTHQMNISLEQHSTTQQKESAVSWSKQNWYEMPVTFYITICCSGLVGLRSWSLAVLNHRLVLPLRVDFLCGLQDFRNIAIGFPKLAPSTCLYPEPLKTLRAERPDRSQDNHNFYINMDHALGMKIVVKALIHWKLKLCKQIGCFSCWSTRTKQQATRRGPEQSWTHEKLWCAWEGHGWIAWKSWLQLTAHGKLDRFLVKGVQFENPLSWLNFIAVEAQLLSPQIGATSESVPLILINAGDL